MRRWYVGNQCWYLMEEMATRISLVPLLCLNVVQPRCRWYKHTAAGVSKGTWYGTCKFAKLQPAERRVSVPLDIFRFFQAQKELMSGQAGDTLYIWTKL